MQYEFNLSFSVQIQNDFGIFWRERKKICEHFYFCCCCYQSNRKHIINADNAHEMKISIYHHNSARSYSHFDWYMWLSILAGCFRCKPIHTQTHNRHNVYFYHFQHWVWIKLSRKQKETGIEWGKHDMDLIWHFHWIHINSQQFREINPLQWEV